MSHGRGFLLAPYPLEMESVLGTQETAAKMDASNTSGPQMDAISHRHAAIRAKNVFKASEEWIAQCEVQRWDGASRACEQWNNLKRDPELWIRDGNCSVHLYAYGQSRRGPAFKIPLSVLLAARAQPLIDRFVSFEGSDSTGPNAGEDWETWHHAHPGSRVDLYISAPIDADKTTAFRYHLATRNFFAWLLRRSLVGESLGAALIELLGSMRDFREAHVDNVGDLVGYLDEEGYLDMTNAPDHALAVLQMAEFYQLRDVYVDAFAHCVGMTAGLFESREYKDISPVTKRLLRRARVKVDLSVGHASTLLRNFLQDDLSESYLGLSIGARAHLELFRKFLIAFYRTRLGRFPPRSTDSRINIFEPAVYVMLRVDFEALYELLADSSFTSTANSPLLAQGGICAVQSVHSFDLRHRFESLKHPLPLLPEIAASQPASRRFPWTMGKQDKLRPDERLVAHAALIKATNHSRKAVLKNDLVQAYRRFEEDSVMHPTHVDRHEKLSLVDARKVRWILIYSTYQVLRSVTEPPPEARMRTRTPSLSLPPLSPYLLSVPTANLPPWRVSKRNRIPTHRHEDDMMAMTVTTGATDITDATDTTDNVKKTRDGHDEPTLQALRSSLPPAFEIKPDIDYTALSRRDDPQPARRRTLPPMRPAAKTPPSRSRSLSMGFRRRSTLRESISALAGMGKGAAAISEGNGNHYNHTTDESPSSPSSASAKLGTAAYHEIVVHGYGNGTNAVSKGGELRSITDLEPSTPPLPSSIPVDVVPTTTTSTAYRSFSTSSNCSGQSGRSNCSQSTNPTSVSVSSVIFESPSRKASPSTAGNPGSRGFSPVIPARRSSTRHARSYITTGNTPPLPSLPSLPSPSRRHSVDDLMPTDLRRPPSGTYVGFPYEVYNSAKQCPNPQFPQSESVSRPHTLMAPGHGPPESSRTWRQYPDGGKMVVWTLVGPGPTPGIGRYASDVTGWNRHSGPVSIRI